MRQKTKTHGLWLFLSAISIIVGICSAQDQSLVAIKLSKEILQEVGLAAQNGDLRLVLREDDLGYFYANRRGLGLLPHLNPVVILDDPASYEIYALPKTDETKSQLLLQDIKIVWESDELLIVSCTAEEAFLVHMFPFKKRLSTPSEPGLPVEIIPFSPPKVTFSYSSLIQDLVNFVSQSNLYTWLRGLTGEDLVTIDGEQYQINTRYSPTAMCRMAGYYLREQFENIGLDVEFDYFGFKTLLKQVVFVNPSHGWAVGKRMTIVHTQDGGESWQEQYWGDEGALNHISMQSNSKGCVVGNNGIVLLTWDGSNWERISVSYTGNINGVDFLDSLVGFACCDGGVILKTMDGGMSWNEIPTGVTSNLYDLRFANHLVGWAVGAGGGIIKTGDGGESWQSVLSPITSDLKEIAIIGADEVIVCGNNGSILRTLDGNNWSKVTSPTAKDLLSIFLVDGVGWACGSDGTLIKSEDNGATWIDIGFSILYDLRDLFFFDTQHGWMVGLGYLSSTDDGGGTWESHVGSVESGDSNVVATIPGTIRPDDIYIICGHYDCISQTPQTYAPGADDNGTGTIATLETARVLRDTDFEGTIRFVCFSREEQGLIGSKAYVEEAYQRGDNIVAALNFDMIGYADISPEDVDIICNTESQWLGDAYEQAVAMYVPDLNVVRHTASYVGSDNSSFWDYGYSSFCGIEDASIKNPNYHRTSDRVSTIDLSFYTKVVKGAVATLATLAVADTVTSGVTDLTGDLPLRVLSNPSYGNVEFLVSPDLGYEGRIVIHNVAGRVINSVRPVQENGVIKGYWNGRDSQGMQVSPGIYLISAEGLKTSAKVVLLR